MERRREGKKERRAEVGPDPLNGLLDTVERLCLTAAVLHPVYKK